MNTITITITLLSSAILFGSGATCRAAEIPQQSTSVDAAFLLARHIPSIGELSGARRILDKDGEHVLVLNRKTGPAPSRPQSGRNEHIELTASYYKRLNHKWQVEWTMHDFVDCPDLDAAAEFLSSAISVTDLNQDGRSEVTIAYRLFCGGGVEPYTVKVILHEGLTKLAIRGESLVQLPGQQSFGGEHKYDKALLQPAYAVYNSIWTQCGQWFRWTRVAEQAHVSRINTEVQLLVSFDSKAKAPDMPVGGPRDPLPRRAHHRQRRLS